MRLNRKAESIMPSKGTRCQTNSKIHWSVKVNSDLLDLKKKAFALTKSSNLPRLDSGRKKGCNEGSVGNNGL